MKSRRFRMMIPAEEEKRAYQRERHAADVAAGRCCAAHHYGCREKQRHTHTQDGDVLLTPRREATS